mmetsp:Transcript_7046/g.7985  ORF Transcript_7046/g.7985 Transcript_7046/m.7985 type:complete len:284 (+) Transcript_7046:278-1129(+)
MVLDDSAAQNNHPCLLRVHRELIDLANVLQNVDDKAAFVEVVEKQIVSDRSVGQSWAEHWDVILPAPVVSALFVVDRLAHPVDDHARREDRALLNLLFVHLFNQRQKKFLKLSVTFIRSQHVADPINAGVSQLSSANRKVADVKVAEALDEVLLDAAGCSDDAVHHFMLAEVSDDVPHSTADHVGGVSEEYHALRILSHFWIFELVVLIVVDFFIRQPPFDHLVDDVNSRRQRGRLNSDVFVTFKEGFVVDAFVEVVALDLLRTGDEPQVGFFVHRLLGEIWD